MWEVFSTEEFAVRGGNFHEGSLIYLPYLENYLKLNIKKLLSTESKERH